ncbi:transposase [Flavobacterium sp. 2]|uniref:transposase n=1 Tax=Flavobacterium sp. 2 TaxID=308053 RepID=UPI003CF60CE6
MSRIYDRDFKIRVIKLSYERGNNAQIGRELNVDPSLISKWRRDYEIYGIESFPGPGYLKLNSIEKKVYELEKRIKETDLKFEILKKGSNLLCQNKLVIFKFIHDNEKAYTISRMCKVLHVGESTYRDWKNQNLSRTKQKKNAIKNQIIEIFFEFKQRYGAQRIAKILQNREHKLSTATIGRYMKELGLYCKISKY